MRRNLDFDQPNCWHDESLPPGPLETQRLYGAVMQADGHFKVAEEDPKPGESERHTIRTHSNLLVDPWDMRVEDVCIDDIAFHLSNETRYAGAAGFYSVGQHSLVVASYFQRPILKVASYLHDGEEYLLKDMPGPVKIRSEMAEYKAAGIRLRKVIFQAFGLLDQYDELMSIIKPIDTEVYYRERASFAGLARPEHHIRIMPSGWSYRPFLLEWNRWYKEVKK